MYTAVVNGGHVVRGGHVAQQAIECVVCVHCSSVVTFGNLSECTHRFIMLLINVSDIHLLIIELWMC